MSTEQPAVPEDFCEECREPKLHCVCDDSNSIPSDNGRELKGDNDEYETVPES